ncbi:hypothetical protein [Nocardia vinacea]|uniref:hypothetical protein n=1 Tax=Nocardia vinacea TaxID=96468 RepID=UPI0012F6BEFA|nr:hypothetical protein [Nocardia vinacea]
MAAPHPFPRRAAQPTPAARANETAAQQSRAARASAMAAQLHLLPRPAAAQPGQAVQASETAAPQSWAAWANETAAQPRLLPAAEPSRVARASAMAVRPRLRPVPRNRVQLPIPHGPGVTRRIPR